MPGRLLSSFRFGNLAEHLGVLLLKSVAAVADVPRTEDVGLDAVASLLRPDEDGNRYAEDNFVVQLKSDSAATLDYRDHELRWLLGQSQPMFIGLVSLKDSGISLYPTLNVNLAVLALHPKRVTLRFGDSGLPPVFAGTQMLTWAGGSDESATVWLGGPLLRWTLSDLVDPNWPTFAYKVLKRFLGLAQREHELLSFGRSSLIEWATNDPDSIRSCSMFMKSFPGDFPSLVTRSMPALHALMMQAYSMPDGAGNSLMMALIHLVAALRDLGTETDPENLFAKLFVGITGGDALDGGRDLTDKRNDDQKRN